MTVWAVDQSDEQAIVVNQTELPSVQINCQMLPLRNNVGQEKGRVRSLLVVLKIEAVSIKRSQHSKTHHMRMCEYLVERNCNKITLSMLVVAVANHSNAIF